MKKLTALVLSFVMLLTSFTAFADDLDFLINGPKNYSADYSVSITFDSAEDIALLLNEINMPSQIELFADVKELLSSLFSVGGTMNVKADMNDDYSKMKMSVTMDGDYGVDFNQNLAFSVDVKMGMWMEIDLSDLENPIYRIVYSHPMLNKYLDMDVFEMLPEEQRFMMAALFRSFINKDFIDETSLFIKELYEKHADIKTSFNTLKINIDNDGFVAMMDEMLPWLVSKISSLFPTGEAGADMVMPVYPSFKGLKILGDEGIKFEYNNRTGTVKTTTDISISLSDICTNYLGMEWMFESKGNIDFTVVEEGKIYDEKSTKVEFPVLTEENCVTFEQFIELLNPAPQPEDDYYYEEDVSYPWFYAYCESTYLPEVDGSIYVPLRALVESAYEDTVEMTYSKGVVTMTSEYFTNFESVSFKSGEDVAYVDGTAIPVGKIVIHDGVTYVSSAFFENVFGWTLDSATYDIMNGIYYFGFFTESW